MASATPVHTEVVFTTEKGIPVGSEQIRIQGIPTDIVSRPEQLRKIMELLDLPEGTVARVRHTTEDVIVR